MPAVNAKNKSGGEKSSCMLVGNAFTNDSRVQKEADSLISSGWKVTVLAVHSPGETSRYEKRANGLQVWRLNCRLPRFCKKLFRNLLERGAVEKSGQTNHKVNPRSHASPVPPKGLGRISLFIANRIIDMRFVYKAVKLNAVVYHAHDYDMLLNGWIAAKIACATLVYDAHEISTDREGVGRIKSYFIGLLERHLAPAADAVIGTTDMRAGIFKDRYQIPRPLVLQNKCTYTQASKTNKIRERLGLRDSKPIVLYQGGLQRGRGLKNLIRIAAKLENAYLVFIGSGAQEAELKEKVSSMGLGNRVFFIPRVTLQELPEYTASADIGISLIRNTCLNHYTTDSNKLFEYLMAGLPTVMSDFPEIRKVVEGYQVGSVVDPLDLAQAIDAIQSLLNNKQLYLSMLNNINKHRFAFSWQSEEGKLLEIYKNLPLRS